MEHKHSVYRGHPYMCNNDGGHGNFVLYYDLLAILMISHTLVKQVWSNLDKDVKKIR